MDELVDDFVRVARRCERAGRAIDEEPLAGIAARLHDAVAAVGKAWSGSWLGFFASIYKADLQPKAPGDFFDAEWGGTGSHMDRTTGRWAQFDDAPLEREILRRAGDPRCDDINEAAAAAERAFEEGKEELLPTIDAVLSKHQDGTLSGLREEISKLKSHLLGEDFLKMQRPNQAMTRNSAVIQEGLQAPFHLRFQAWLVEESTYFSQAKELAKLSMRAARYLEKKMAMKGRTMSRTDGKVFVGHGGAQEWRKLKDFLTDRLGLAVEEYNTVPTAGRSRKERLQEMLDTSVFAFLVMTAEDEHADGTKHARENVIHEVGLFQGRYGFERAIVLLEHECMEFSNIAGIDQLRFPKGAIESQFEDVRRVLEREGIVAR